MMQAAGVAGAPSTRSGESIEPCMIEDQVSHDSVRVSEQRLPCGIDISGSEGLRLPEAPKEQIEPLHRRGRQPEGLVMYRGSPFWNSKRKVSNLLSEVGNVTRSLNLE